MAVINRLYYGSKSDIVSSIGDLDSLITDDKDSVVDAINEVASNSGITDSVTPKLQQSSTVFNDDGSITETFADGGTITTVFNDDGSITETATYKDGTVVTKTTTVDSDGNVTEVIS